MEGAARFARKLRRAPQLVGRYLPPAMEKSATEMVAMMQRFAPDHLKDKIEWTWGDAPEGARVIGRVGKKTDDLRITVFVDSAWAHWWEFGTAERYQKTTGRYAGRIEAEPFFWVSYRLLKKRIQRRLKAAMRKAIKEAMRG